MNAKLVGSIAMGVFVMHIAVFMIIARVRMNSQPPFVPPPEPNFRVAEKVIVDPETGKKTTYREIHVSTKLADPDYPASVNIVPAAK